MGLKRRDFFKMATVGSVAVLGSKSLAGEESRALDSAQALGVLVDAVVGIGCCKCEWGL